MIIVSFSAAINNPILQAAFFGWLAAQVLKVVFVFIKEKKIDYTKMISSGGMPSSHSSLVVAVATAVGRYAGTGSTAFGLAVAFAVVVMYDAANVRREAGRQGRLLNKIVEDFYREHRIDEKKFKELLGHTPLEVAGGVIVGIIVGMLV